MRVVSPRGLLIANRVNQRGHDEGAGRFRHQVPIIRTQCAITRLSRRCHAPMRASIDRHIPLQVRMESPENDQDSNIYLHNALLQGSNQSIQRISIIRVLAGDLMTVGSLCRTQ
jgi:hypothetical protein